MSFSAGDNRKPVYRDSDGELVGWLEPITGSPSVRAVTLLGHTVAQAVSEDEARRMLEAEGLAALGIPWWVRVPAPLLPETDLRDAPPGWRWRQLVVTELNATRARLSPPYPAPEEFGVQVAVALPVDDVLFAAMPEE